MALKKSPMDALLDRVEWKCCRCGKPTKDTKAPCPHCRGVTITLVCVTCKRTTSVERIKSDGKAERLETYCPDCAPKER